LAIVTSLACRSSTDFTQVAKPTKMPLLAQELKISVAKCCVVWPLLRKAVKPW